MRLSSPGQTRRRLTEKRILAGYLTEKRILAGYLTEKRTLHVGPHGKAHFGRAPGAHLTKRRILAVPELAECVFP